MFSVKTCLCSNFWVEVRKLWKIYLHVNLRWELVPHVEWGGEGQPSEYANHGCFPHLYDTLCHILSMFPLWYKFIFHIVLFIAYLYSAEDSLSSIWFFGLILMVCSFFIVVVYALTGIQVFAFWQEHQRRRGFVGMCVAKTKLSRNRYVMPRTSLSITVLCLLNTVCYCKLV